MSNSSLRVRFHALPSCLTDPFIVFLFPVSLDSEFEPGSIWFAGALSFFIIVFCVHVGGYDVNVPENVQVLAELKALASRLQVTHLVTFKPSISDQGRNELLQGALCVIYTPTNEHFGIVPIEAMYAGTPVLASASGGPLETVVDGVTGYLRPSSDPRSFSDAMASLLNDQTLGRTLGQAAHAHVKAKFGMDNFEDQIHAAVLEAHALYFKKSTHLYVFAALIALLLALVVWPGRWLSSP